MNADKKDVLRNELGGFCFWGLGGVAGIIGDVLGICRETLCGLKGNP
jgi:hypothetical protein